jgi:hypothetical protein
MTNDDLLAQTDAILEQDHWWHEPDLQAKLKAIWGDAINDCGVFINGIEEVLYDKDSCKASVCIGTAHGLYAYGCNFSYPMEGFGHAPSITGELFTSHGEARTSAIESLLKRLPDKQYVHEEGNRVRLDRIRGTLQGLLIQPSLF